MLLSILPFAIVDSSIFPLKDANALSLIVHEVAFILLSIGPFEQATTVHLILFPFAGVSFAIGPDIPALPADFVLQEGARVY